MTDPLGPVLIHPGLRGRFRLDALVSDGHVTHRKGEHNNSAAESYAGKDDRIRGLPPVCPARFYI